MLRVGGIAPLGPWPLRALKCLTATVVPGSNPATGPGAMPPASRHSGVASFGTGDGAHPISVDCYPMAGHELRDAANALGFACARSSKRPVALSASSRAHREECPRQTTLVSSSSLRNLRNRACVWRIGLPEKAVNRRYLKEPRKSPGIHRHHSHHRRRESGFRRYQDARSEGRSGTFPQILPPTHARNGRNRPPAPSESAGSAGFQPARGQSVACRNVLDRAGSAGFQPARGQSPRMDASRLTAWARSKATPYQ